MKNWSVIQLARTGSGSSVTNKTVRPRTKCSSESEEYCAQQELNGLGEGEDAMTDEEGEGVEGEGEAGAADWRVRTGPRNKPTARKRGAQEATHILFRDWCAHCMMGRGRTHHHVSKKSCGDLSRRPIIAMDHYFLQPNSTVNSQTIPDESVTCIPAKEHRDQNIMSSVALKKEVEEPWTVERVAKFIDLLGYREITSKSDTEPAIVAFRYRVAENCNAEVTSEDAVKGDKPSNGLVENAMMLLCGVIRTIKCHVESCTQEELVGGTCGEHLVQVPEGSRRSDAIRKIAWKESQHKSLCHSERRCWRE